MIASPVAQRVLRVVGTPERSIVVSIGCPALDPDPTGDWICPVYIEGIEDAGPHIVHGADSLQALLLTTELIRKKLDDSRLLLIWQNDEPGNICIPRMMIYHAFGGEFARRIEQYIDDQMAIFSETPTSRKS